METKKPGKEYTEYILKIKKSCSLPRPLENYKGYTIHAEIETNGQNEIPNQDGTFKLIWTGWLTGIITVENEEGKTIKTIPKAKKSQSQNLRLHIMQSSHPENHDSEEYYQKRMTQLRHFWKDVEFLLDKLKADEDDANLKGEV